MMDQVAKNTTANSPKMDAPQTFRATAQNGSAQAKEPFGKVSESTAEATGLLKDNFSTAAKGVQDYNTKFFESPKLIRLLPSRSPKNCRA